MHVPKNLRVTRRLPHANRSRRTSTGESVRERARGRGGPARSDRRSTEVPGHAPNPRSHIYIRCIATNVYIDGFNLYYGAVKGTPHRWLDLEALAAKLLPKDQVKRVRYFTALVSARATDPDGPARQRTYLRALGTLPKVSVHLGHFLVHPTRMPLAQPPAGGPTTVEVIKTEEKGSDVNLASYLLVDAAKGDCDTAVIISNDSDLKETVRLARYELGVKVGVVNPHPASRRSRVLSAHAHFFKQLRVGALADSQFPRALSDADGSFSKPSAW